MLNKQRFSISLLHRKKLMINESVNIRFILQIRVPLHFLHILVSLSFTKTIYRS
jgi:hypothetical protein